MLLIGYWHDFLLSLTFLVVLSRIIIIIRQNSSPYDGLIKNVEIFSSREYRRLSDRAS